MEISNFIYDPAIWPFGFSDAFISYLNKDIQGEVIFIENDGIILPLIIKKKFIFKIGYFVHPSLRNGLKISKEDEHSFFEALSIFLLNQQMVDFILPPTHIEVFSHIPTKAVGYEIGIIRLDLRNKKEEEVFANFRANFRNLIRKADRDGIEIKFGIEYFNDFYKIYKENQVFKDAIYDSEEKIRLIIENPNLRDNITCGIAINKGKIETAILNVESGNIAYYLFAGNSTNNHQGSNRLLQWEIIKYYIKKGYHYYYMGGARFSSMKSEKFNNIEFFKMGFGSEIEKGYHFKLILNNRGMDLWIFQSFYGLLETRIND